jgi:NAD(P)H-quinone oxidoreductase subunit 4
MMLSLFLIIPLLGAIAAYAVPRMSRHIALAAAMAMAAVGLLSLSLFDTGIKTLQLIEKIPWLDLGGFTVSYHLGVDGISYPMVLLTAFLAVVAVLVSRREVHTREAPYYAILLGDVAAIAGVFMAQDLVMFFVFWEAVLVLTFLLILLWGGENRKYASMKFLIFTGLGSAFLLIAIIMLAVYGKSVDLVTLAGTTLPLEAQYAFLALLVLAFFIKMPIVPFHTWLPDAHVQAPTAGSILLAGVMLKMGAYGLLRLGSLVPDAIAAASPFLFWMGVITIIYGAWVCLAQDNLKRLIAYSSVNHMGFVLVGIATGSALGITGVVFEMVSHGILAALLFALAGVVHQQTGTFDLGSLHGLIRKMPKVGWFMVVASFGALGLPSMTGFIAEFIIIFASFQEFGMFTLVPLAGMILAGGYFLRLLAKAVFGRNDRLAIGEQRVSMLPFGLLLAASFLLGLLPFLLIDIIRASVLT